MTWAGVLDLFDGELGQLKEAVVAEVTEIGLGRDTALSGKGVRIYHPVPRQPDRQMERPTSGDQVLQRRRQECQCMSRPSMCSTSRAT